MRRARDLLTPRLTELLAGDDADVPFKLSWDKRDAERQTDADLCLRPAAGRGPS